MDKQLTADREIIHWLLSGDVSIQYQVYRDLLQSSGQQLRSYQQKIATEGWGARLLKARRPDGHWGKGFYQPKWTSTHYTLLDLKNLGFPPNHPAVRESVDLILDAPKGKEEEINFSKTRARGDICVNGMILNYGSWFMENDERLHPVIRFLLDTQMNDGGWNCEYFERATHSSLHSTISVLEGLLEWAIQGDSFEPNAIANAISEGEEFILIHRLFLSHKKGTIIDPKMLRLSYPCRWRYDILRALDYFRKAGRAYDPRMDEALHILTHKQRPAGYWPLQQRHPGLTHFEMETPGKASRWNTLRALRVLRHFKLSTKEEKR